MLNSLVSHLILAAANPASTVIGNSIKSGCGSSCPSANTLTTVTAPHIINLLLYLVGAISIIMIIVGGLRYVISAGNPSAVSGAKDTILYAVVGLVLSLAAFSVVTFVTGKFGI